MRKCGRMEAQYIHTSILPNFHPRTKLAEFVLDGFDISCAVS